MRFCALFLWVQVGIFHVWAEPTDALVLRQLVADRDRQSGTFRWRSGPQQVPMSSSSGAKALAVATQLVLERLGEIGRIEAIIERSDHKLSNLDRAFLYAFRRDLKVLRSLQVFYGKDNLPGRQLDFLAKKIGKLKSFKKAKKRRKTRKVRAALMLWFRENGRLKLVSELRDFRPADTLSALAWFEAKRELVIERAKRHYVSGEQLHEVRKVLERCVAILEAKITLGELSESSTVYQNLLTAFNELEPIHDDIETRSCQGKIDYNASGWNWDVDIRRKVTKSLENLHFYHPNGFSAVL